MSAKLKSKRRPIDEEWENYERKVIPASAGSVQRREMKNSFYAGSASLFSLIMRSLEGGEEATDGDLRFMDAIEDNIKRHFEGEARKAK